MTGPVLALIPAYNEALRIEPVIAGVRERLPVLVIDDGSIDPTAERARRAGAAVLRQEPNQGKGAALRAGFRRALDEGREAVLTLDADGQHDPAEIPRFLELWSGSRTDLIIGARDFRRMPAVRRLANRVARWSFSRAVGRPVADNQSGYRLISAPLQRELLASEEPGFEFEVEMIATCIRRGMRLAEVPIRTIYAGEESHIDPWRHTVRFFRVVRAARRAVRAR